MWNRGFGPVDVVVIGHAGLSTVRTPHDRHTSPGGSGYAVAASAAALIGRRVGLVAQVGRDFDLSVLHNLGVNLDGVERLPGRSAKLRIRQYDDGTRSFDSELGVAEKVRTDSFPPDYLRSSFIHLGTAPPEQQLTWLRFLRAHGCTAQISADMFEHFVKTDRDGSLLVCDDANLVFMNQAEYRELYPPTGGPVPKQPIILKRGPSGARVLVDGLTHYDVLAPTASAVDTTGGGEILAGVYLALRAAGLTKKPSLEYAVRAAAACVEEFGVHGPRLASALADIRRDLTDRRPCDVEG
jgi:ribokinase